MGSGNGMNKTQLNKNTDMKAGELVCTSIDDSERCSEAFGRRAVPARENRADCQGP